MSGFWDQADYFDPHVGRAFLVEDGRHVLTLREVERRPAMNSPLSRQPFILLFDGPPGDVLPEGLHTLKSEDGQDITLHLMPIHTPSPGRQDYQAVFG